MAYMLRDVSAYNYAAITGAPYPSTLGAPLADYGTFDGWQLGAPKKKKKKRGLLRRVGRVAKKVGKVALKAAPVVAGLTLGPAGGVVVGAASGAIGRGKPKLKRILRGAAIGGAAGLVRTGQAGKILVKGAKAAAKLAKAGGRVVSKIPKEVIGGSVIGAGGGAVVESLKKKRRRRPESQEEAPEGPVIDVSPRPPIEPPEGYPRPPIVFPEPEPPPSSADAGPLPQANGSTPPSPADQPTAGQLPVAGGLIPGPAVNAVMPGAGGEQFAPDVVPEDQAAAEPTAGRNTALLIAVGVGVVLILSQKKGKRRR